MSIIVELSDDLLDYIFTFITMHFINDNNEYHYFSSSEHSSIMQLESLISNPLSLYPK